MIHVDDLLISGSETHEQYHEFIDWMKQRFVWGAWERSSFVQCGLEYVQRADMTIEITCTTATRRIEPIPIYSGRRKLLTPYQQTQCREVLGALQWCATQVLFWICGDVSLLQGRI